MAITDLDFFRNASPAEKDLIKALRAKRAGYEEERLLHNFLLDSYIGGGGFQNGMIPSPDAPFWGRRAYERGRSEWSDTRQTLTQPPIEGAQPRAACQSETSYLVSFHGEDQDSYIDRIKTSAYHNPVEAVVRFTNALLFQQDAQRDGMPPDVAAWIMNADRRRRHISHIGRNVALRGQIFGWGGTVLDMPKLRASSLAESRAQDLSPYCVSLCPQEFLDWDMDPDGTASALKIATMHEHPRASLLEMKLWEEHILLLYRNRWERYVILMPPASVFGSCIPDDAGRILYERIEKGENPYGQVRASFFAWDEGLGGVSSFGLPQIFNLAKVAWDVFQQNSELRTMMRAQTFATLVLPQTTAGGVKGNVAVGTGNFLSEPREAKGLTRYISPPASNAQVYEKRIEATGETMHAMAGVDSGMNKRGSETAEAMRIRYQKTEAMLFNAAVNLENWELPILRGVGRSYGIRDAVLDKMSVYRPKVFDVARFGTQIDEAEKVLKMPWGEGVLASILKRTMRSALPNIGERDLLEFDREIEKTVAANHDRFLQKVLGSEPAEPSAATSSEPTP